MMLSRHQSECLNAIRPLFSGGMSPTLDMIAQRCGLASRSGAHRLVEGLVAAGRLRKVEGDGRRPLLELVNPSDRLREFTDAALLAEIERRGLR